MEEQNTELKLFGKPCTGPTAQLVLFAAFLQAAIIHAPDLLFSQWASRDKNVHSERKKKKKKKIRKSVFLLCNQPGSLRIYFFF